MKKHTHFNGGMSNSLLKEFRFKIGEQYELNEFNLKSLESTFSNGLEYENYEYIKGDIITFLGIEIYGNIILQYNTDILCGIIYSFEINKLSKLVSRLEKYSDSNLILKVFEKNDKHFKLVIKNYKD
ncbi:MAG: hypothetical protein ACTJGD_02785 [Mesonia hippocampi]|uniref:hypothetical protein n=1 Tax=Mesonia hippocampi TaxID=1628250 RepID=UPI003F9CC4FC